MKCFTANGAPGSPELHEFHERLAGSQVGLARRVDLPELETLSGGSVMPLPVDEAAAGQHEPSSISAIRCLSPRAAVTNRLAARIGLIVALGSLLLACGPEADLLEDGSDAGGFEGDDAPGSDATVLPDGRTIYPDGGGDDGGPGGGDSGTAGECLDDIAFFEEKVWRPTLSLRCIGCHQEGAIAGDSSLVLLPETASDYLQRNFDAVTDLALDQISGTSVLLLKPTGRHPDGHTGGMLLDIDSRAYADLEELVGRIDGTLSPCDDPVEVIECTDDMPGPRQLRRLTRFEYDRTASDLLGFEVSEGQAFTPENVVAGFDNNAGVLDVTTLLATQLFGAAEALAAQAVSTPGLLPCSPEVDGADACGRLFIEDFGTRAFRRPMTSIEVDRYMEVFTDVVAVEGFDAAISDIITAMLISPNFLYRTELGERDEDGYFRLSAHELASELSYLIWGTMPDDILREAAESGDLLDASEREAQARRLLADPRAEDQLSHFSRQWLDIDGLPTVARDAAAFPELTPGVRQDMLRETDAFISDVLVDQGAPISDLFTSAQTFTTAALDSFYAGQTPGAAGGALTPNTLNERGGLLTQGSVLTTHSLPTHSSPIHRGKFVRERLLCAELPPPPPGLETEPPPLDPTLTNRERLSMHSSDPACAGCHRLVDPIGFAFEHYDGIGRYRELHNGLEIDVTGEIVATDHSDATFEGVWELQGLLAESEDVEDCYAEQWFRYGFGTTGEDASSCSLDGVQQRFREGGLTQEAVILALVQSPHFTSRIDPDDPPTDPDEPVEPGDDTGVGGDTGGMDAGAADTGGTDTGGVDIGVDDAGTGTDAGTPTGDLSVSQEITTDWGAGYCAAVVVRNEGSAAVTWVITLEVQGTLSDHWNAEVSGDGPELEFRGVEWNADLAPGGQADFGFCANR